MQIKRVIDNIHNINFITFNISNLFVFLICPSKLVVLPRPTNPVYITIYELMGRETDGFMPFQRQKTNSLKAANLKNNLKQNNLKKK